MTLTLATASAPWTWSALTRQLQTTPSTWCSARCWVASPSWLFCWSPSTTAARGAPSEVVINKQVSSGMTVDADELVFYRIDHDRSVWNGKPISSENGNTITVSPNHQYVHHHHHHKMHNGFADQHRPLYVVDGSHNTENDETAETSFCDGTHRSSGDLLRSTDSLSRNSLKRGYIRNGSTPSLHQQQHPARKIGDCNTLPLLMHHSNGRHDPCLDDAEWEASVPPADSEKFI